MELGLKLDLKLDLRRILRNLLGQLSKFVYHCALSFLFLTHNYYGFGSTMEEIMTFTTSQASRSRFQRVTRKSEDADAVKSLNIKLDQAFQIFQVSNIPMFLA